MKAPAWIAVAAVPALLLALAVPSIAGDPDAIRRSIFGDENQSRLENERLQREHNERLNRAMRQMEQMDRGSSGKTYYLGGCDVKPNDPSCMLDKERADEGRSPPPQQRPTYDPYASKPYPPARSRGDCEPSGLFGAPPQDCINPNNRPVPKPARWVGEGPCRRDASISSQHVDSEINWGACGSYSTRVADKECGDPRSVPWRQQAQVEDCRMRVISRVRGWKK